MDDFQIDLINDVAVIKVNILTATHRDAKPLWDEMESKLIFNQKKIVIDLSFCNNVDSTFIGMIVKIFRKVQEKDGKMKMVYPEVKNTEVFIVTGLPKIINFYNTLEEALDSFK